MLYELLLTPMGKSSCCIRSDDPVEFQVDNYLKMAYRMADYWILHGLLSYAPQ
jgi:hypothetical protein